MSRGSTQARSLLVLLLGGLLLVMMASNLRLRSFLSGTNNNSAINSCYAFASHSNNAAHQQRRGFFYEKSLSRSHSSSTTPQNSQRHYAFHRILRGGSSSSSSTPSPSITSSPLSLSSSAVLPTTTTTTRSSSSSTSSSSLHSSTQQSDSTSTSTTSNNNSSTTPDTSTSTTTKSMADWAQGCLAIAGTTSSASQLKSFGGLSYRDDHSSLHDNKHNRTEGQRPPPPSFRVLFILGGPGAGKGTQCDLLKEHYPCVHLSAGELLREEAANKKGESEHAALIEECLVAGKIVPVEISLALLRNAMKAASGQSILFLIDGFPRNFDNLEGWTRVMAHGEDAAAVWGVLSYDCPLPILEKRVMERSKDSGRSDDNLESLRRRFKTFQAQTVPVVDTLRLIQQDSLLKVVDIAGDQSLENVWEETQKTMNNFVANDILSANAWLLEAVASRDVEAYRSLCAEEMFVDVQDNESSVHLSPEQIMAVQEGTEEQVFNPSSIKCAEMTFVTGKQVSLTYNRTLGSGEAVKETRIWSHKGSKGWRMIHFSRISL